MKYDHAIKPVSADRGCLGVFGFVWIAFWTLCTLALDSFIGYRAVRQTVALFHPTVPGTIVRCDVREDRDGDEVTYDLNVEYVYEVAGRGYTGTRYAHDPMWELGDDPHTVAARLRPDERVAVHYSPHNPAEAVLAPGLSDGDLFIWLFLTPFNVVMLLGWRAYYRCMRRVESDIKLGPIGPWTAAALAALATSFVSVFVVGFAGGGMLLTSIAWGMVLGVSGWTFVWRWQRPTCENDEPSPDSIAETE